MGFSKVLMSDLHSSALWRKLSEQREGFVLQFGDMSLHNIIQNKLFGFDWKIPSTSFSYFGWSFQYFFLAPNAQTTWVMPWLLEFSCNASTKLNITLFQLLNLADD